MKKDDKEREREIKKARENTVKSIDNNDGPGVRMTMSSSRHTCRKTMISQRRYSAQDLSLMRQSAARFFPYPNARRLIKHQTGSARCTFLSGMASTICFLCFLHL